MTMAETERRPGKTPLLKQTEVEEEEEAEGSPNSDVSDLTITAAETPHAQSSTSSEDLASPNDSDNSEAKTPNHVQALPKPKQLVREKAVCEEPGTPVDVSTLAVPDGAVNSKDGHCDLEPRGKKLEKCESSSSEAGTLSSLSRGSSLDAQYKDNTGIDLEEFIKKTLNKSTKDRKMLQQLEKDFKKFIDEPSHQYLQLPEMSSYDRMLVHRIAAFFGLDHNVDQSGKAVIVSKTKITRIPDFRFEDYIQKNEGHHVKQVLKRKEKSLDEKESMGLERAKLEAASRAKSLEERQRSYDETRARIFSNGESQIDEDVIPVTTVSRSKSSLLNSKEDLGGSKQWSSTDSSGYGTDNGNLRNKSHIKKSHSYAGVPNQHMLRINFRQTSLHKTDSICGNASFDSHPLRPPPMPSTPPSSHSDASPLSRSSSAGPSPLAAGPLMGGQTAPLAVLVAPDYSSVPPGTIIVNPQTLQPHLNPDGTIYRFDPNHPPPFMISSGASTPMNSHMQGPVPAFTNESGMDMYQRLQGMSISQPQPDASIMETQNGGMSQMVSGQQIMITHQPNQPYTMQPSSTYMPQNYYQGAPGVTGQAVRYMAPVSYVTSTGQQPQGASMGPSESQPAPQPSMGHPGQYGQQPYMSSYCPQQYPMVFPSTCQAPTPMGPGSIPESSPYQPPQPTMSYTNVTHGGDSGYTLQYGYNQAAYGQSQPPVYYNVPTSSATSYSYSFTGQGGLRPATPPSQGTGVLPNPAMGALSVGQPLSYGQPAGAGHGPYGGYPPTAAPQGQGPRPVGQVMQFSSMQTQSPSQTFILRPNMQVNMQPSYGSQGGQGGQTVMGVKTYCVGQKGMEMGKDATGHTMYTHPVSVSPHLSTGTQLTAAPTMRPPHQLEGGDLRMMASTGFRPQLQPLQFTQRTVPQQQATTPQRPRAAVNHNSVGKGQRGKKSGKGGRDSNNSTASSSQVSLNTRQQNEGAGEPSPGSL